MPLTGVPVLVLAPAEAPSIETGGRRAAILYVQGMAARWCQ